jgi:predicted ATP-grasp superfamily ATP-dependent carboligase
MKAHWALFSSLADKIAKLLPDASGYVGIDLIVSYVGKNQPKMTILEVNPRLTTTYVALSEATGLNPAKLIIDTVMEAYAEPSQIGVNEVLLKVTHA